MRFARTCLLVVLVVACGGKDQGPTPAPVTTNEPLVDGKTVAAWCADVESRATCRAAAATCLAALKAASPLASALRDPTTREAASAALLSMGADALPAVESAARDPNTQSVATELLAKIRGTAVADSVAALADPAKR